MSPKPDESRLVLSDFLDRFGGARLRSTGARRVRYTQPLYNVSGSEKDPIINGYTWKKLLEKNDVAGDCFVVNVPAEPGSSHPGFNVGGHMTPNSDGSVAYGGISYLMPLCFWHNHTNRNGMAFERSREWILELSGYMLAEPAATFMARRPSNGAYSLIKVPAGQTPVATAPSIQTSSSRTVLHHSLQRDHGPSSFILFRRVETDQGTFYEVDDANIAPR